MVRTEDNFIRALIDVDANVLDTMLTRDERSFDIDDMLKNEMPALHFAVIFRRIDLVMVLLNHGADINLTNREGETCLHLAVDYILSNRKVKQIQKVLKDVAIDNACKEKLTAPFSMESENLLNIQKLFGDDCSKFDTIYYADDSENDILLVQLLLNSGTDPNIENDNEYSPLMVYCSHGEKDIMIMHLLLEYDADIEMKTDFNSTAIGLATECSPVEKVATLLDAGACDDLPMNRFPLYYATYNNGTGRIRKRETVPIIQLLVERGASVDFMSEESNYVSALIAAVAIEESLDNVKCLLSLGANPNLYIEGGPEFADEPPLWYAMYSAYPEIAECLIDHRADIFYKDHNGATLLNAAMLDNHNSDYPKLSSYYAKDALNCVTLLMERGVIIGKNDYMNLNQKKIELLKNSQQELKVLKETRIHPGFHTTYFDFLIKRDQPLVRCLRNEKIKAVMESEDYKEKFTYFANRLEANYHRGLILTTMTDELRSILSDVFEEVFPQEIILAICGFFNQDDLRMFFST